MLSCESGMHVASFQDGTSALPDLEYAKGINKIVVMKFNTTPHCYLSDPNNKLLSSLPYYLLCKSPNGYLMHVSRLTFPKEKIPCNLD